MLHVHVNVHVHIYRNAGPSGIQSVRYQTEKKLTTPEQVWYRTKLTQSGIFLVQYRTKIRDAGMPMPALVSSMPMPSYDTYQIHLDIRTSETTSYIYNYDISKTPYKYGTKIRRQHHQCRTSKVKLIFELNTCSEGHQSEYQLRIKMARIRYTGFMIFAKITARYCYAN
jgi:hypothetical protein